MIEHKLHNIYRQYKYLLDKEGFWDLDYIYFVENRSKSASIIFTDKGLIITLLY